MSTSMVRGEEDDCWRPDEECRRATLVLANTVCDAAGFLLRQRAHACQASEVQHLVDDVRAAVESQNWYGALALTLALPDIAAYLETPGAAVGVRYRRWWTANAEDIYRPRLGQASYLPASDAYALRCAFLHSGDLEIEQNAYTVLERFRFVVPPPGVVVHNNRINDALQLQVDHFCQEIAAAVEQWMPRIGPDVRQRMNTLPLIEVFVPGQPFTI